MKRAGKIALVLFLAVVVFLALALAIRGGFAWGVATWGRDFVMVLVGFGIGFAVAVVVVGIAFRVEYGYWQGQARNLPRRKGGRDGQILEPSQHR